MSSGYTLEPGELEAASATLTSVGDGLRQQSAALGVAPDAGSSSQEVAQAFARLADELRGIAQAVASTAGSVDASLAAYRTTDAQVGQGLGGLTPR